MIIKHVVVLEIMMLSRVRPDNVFESSELLHLVADGVFVDNCVIVLVIELIEVMDPWTYSKPAD